MAYSWYNPNESVVNAQKKKEEVQAQQPGAYTPSAAVTNAQNKVQNLEANKPGEYTPTAREQAADAQLQSALNSKPGAYTPSDSVQAAQSALNSVLASKPQNFQSKYGQALENILMQIQNPKEFKYEFNGDNLFKSYADLYTQNGKQASMDAMGQAAALTGGYGNSYAQQVGNQAYDEYLRALYDKGLELHDRAYQKYADQRADLYNQYGAISDADNTDYNRYRDTVGDWKDDRAFYADRYDTERNFDYGKYRDDKGDWYKDVDLYTDLYRDERDTGYERHRDTVSDWYQDYDNANKAYQYEDNKDYTQHRDNVSDWKDLLSYYTDEANDERNFDYGAYTDMLDFDEDVRQFNESLDWEKLSDQQKYAAEYVMSILANGQMPSEELLRQAGLSAEDAAKMMAVLVTGGTGGTGKKSTPKTYYTDMYGNYYYFDENGSAHMVDSSKVTKDDIVDSSLGNLQYNLGNGVKDAAKTVTDTWNGSNLKNSIDSLTSTASNLINGTLSMLGLGNSTGNKTASGSVKSTGSNNSKGNNSNTGLGGLLDLVKTTTIDYNNKKKNSGK